MKRLGMLVAVLVGCGSDGSDTPDPDGPAATDGPGGGDGPSDGPSAVFAITSPAFTEGGVIPEEITCNGNNTSPQLDWTDAPAGTLSFAIVLTDKTNNLRHSAIYDIPGNLTGLPADVEKAFAPSDVPGAHQTRSFNNGPIGYRGPCPGTVHTYEFAIYALDVAALPGLTMNSSPGDAETAALTHDLAVAKLTGTYDPNQ